jgi:hypothetical protein
VLSLSAFVAKMEFTTKTPGQEELMDLSFVLLAV